MTRPQPLTVLVIDDNESIAQLLGAFLESAGYRVLVATAGPAGLEMALTRRPDLIVCDSLMPRVSGREILDRIRERQDMSDTPFILMSGAPEEHEFASAFLAKPFTLEEAVAAVNIAAAQLREPAAH